MARRDSAAARGRFEEVVAAGVLRPRGDVTRDLAAPGSVRELDVLAGDGRYVFLSLGPRYRQVREPDLCYGWVFDAERLVRAGALVGPDLLADYEEIVDRIAREMESFLPPPTDADMAEFAALFGGDDPEMLAAVAEMARSDYWDILEAIERGKDDDPVAVKGRRRFREEAVALQASKRVSGNAAMEMLREGGRLEILWPGDLSLELAVGRIEAGEIKCPHVGGGGDSIMKSIDYRANR